MKASGLIVPGDLVEAGWLHVLPRRKTDSVIGILFFLLASWALAVSFLQPDRLNMPRGRWVVVACLLYMGFSFGIYHPYKCRREYAQRKGLKRPVEFEASDAGIHSIVEATETLTPWNEFHKWREGRRIFLLYLSDTTYHMVPKRFFATVGDIEEFRGLLKKHIKEV